MNKLSVLFLLVAIDLTAQPRPGDIPDFSPRFEAFHLPGGAIANSVQKILQDSTGFLWFGSQGGLHRYDGQSFITYIYDALDWKAHGGELKVETLSAELSVRNVVKAEAAAQAGKVGEPAGEAGSEFIIQLRIA